jgi:hypothetical protein
MPNIIPVPDKTPAEATSDFLAEFSIWLQRENFTHEDRITIVANAAPAVATYYLKGV